MITVAHSAALYIPIHFAAILFQWCWEGVPKITDVIIIYGLQTIISFSDTFTLKLALTTYLFYNLCKLYKDHLCI